MTIKSTAAWLLILAAAAAGVTGCGFGPATAPLTGTVTFDGEPLKFGTVMLQHEEGGQPARAEIQPDGSFVLSTFRPEDGARVGSHRVRVTCYEKQDPSFTGPRGDSLGATLIPRKYTNAATSGLRVTVEASSNEPLVLELQSDGARR